MATFWDIIKASQKTSLPASNIPEVKFWDIIKASQKKQVIKPNIPEIKTKQTIIKSPISTKEPSTLDKIIWTWKWIIKSLVTTTPASVFKQIPSAIEKIPLIWEKIKPVTESLVSAFYTPSTAEEQKQTKDIIDKYQPITTLDKTKKIASKLLLDTPIFDKWANRKAQEFSTWEKPRALREIVDVWSDLFWAYIKLISPVASTLVESWMNYTWTSKKIQDTLEEWKKFLYPITDKIWVNKEDVSASIDWIKTILDARFWFKSVWKWKIAQSKFKSPTLWKIAKVWTEAYYQSIPDLTTLILWDIFWNKSDVKDLVKAWWVTLLSGTIPTWKLDWKKSAIPEIKPEAPVKELPKTVLDKIIPENEVVAKDIIKQETLAAEKKSPTKSLWKIAPEDIKLYSEYNKLPLSEQKWFEQFKADKQVMAITPKETTKQPTVLDKILPVAETVKPVVETLKQPTALDNILPVVETKPAVETPKEIISKIEEIKIPTKNEQTKFNKFFEKNFSDKKYTEWQPKLNENIIKLWDNNKIYETSNEIKKYYTWWDFVDNNRVKYYEEQIKQWNQLPVVIWDKYPFDKTDSKIIIDWNHKLKAYLNLWIKEIPIVKMDDIYNNFKLTWWKDAILKQPTVLDSILPAKEEIKPIETKISEELPFDLTEEQVQKQELEKVVNEEISSIKKEAKDELVDAVWKKWNVRLTPLAKVGKKVWGWITSIYWLNSHLNDIKVKIWDKAEASVIELVRSFQVWKKKVATNIFNRLLKNTVDTLDNKMIDDSFNKILQDADNIIDTSKVINNRIEWWDKSKVKEKVKDVFDAVVWWKNFIRNIPSLWLNKKYKSIEKLAAIQHLYSYNPEYFKSNYPELATYLDGIQTNLDKISKVVYWAAWKDLQDRWLLKFIWEDYKHDIVLKSVFEKWFKEVEFEMDKINYKFNSFQQFKSFVEANRDNSKFKNSSIASILKEKWNAEDYHIKSDLYRLIDYMSEYWETVWNDNIYKTIKSLTKSADEWVRKYSEWLRWAWMFWDAVMQLSWINPVRAWFIWKWARTLWRVALAKVIVWNARVFWQAITSWLAKAWVNTIIENIKWLTPLAKWEKPKLYNPINYKNLREATPTLEKYWFLEVSDFWPDLDNKTLLDKSINVFAWAPIDKAFKYSNSMLLMQKFLKDNNISFKGWDALDITNKFDEMMQNKSIAEQVKIENEIHDMNDTISNFNPDWRSRLKLINNIPTMWALKTFWLSTTWTNLKQFSNLIDWVYQLNKEWLKQAWKAGQILATNFWSYYLAYAIWTTLFNKIFWQPEDEDEKQMQIDFSKKYANQSVWNPVDIAVNATLWLANSIAFIPFKDVKAWVSAIIEFVRTNNPEAIEVWLDKILQWFAAYQTVSNISWWALDSLIKSSLWQWEETTPTTAGGSIKWTWAGDIMSPYWKKLFKTLLFDLDSTVTNSVISKINDIQRKSKEAEQKWEVFVPTKEDNWFVDALNILVPSMEDIDAKIWFVIKDYKDFLWANQSDESFERQWLKPLLKFASYSKDMDIARNRNYTYSVLKMLEDYKKKSNWEPLFYKDLADLIWLKEESVLSEAQDKNLTNVKNVNKQIEKILNESYPKLYAMYWWDVIAMTDDLKENNPVAYNNFVWWLVRVKRILDEWWFDSTTERWQEKVAQEFSSWRWKNVIDWAISTYNKTKPLSTSFAEQVKQTISWLKSNDTNQIKNKLATLEAISKLIVKDAAYTKNASDSIAEMVNSLSKKDLETLYDLPWDRDLILEQYPTIKELLQYSLTLRWVDVPKEQFKTTWELIWKWLPIPEIKEEIISEPTTNITKEITPITWQTWEDKYTSAIDKLQFFPQEKKKKETKSKSLTELLWYDKQPKKSWQTIQTSSYLDKSNSAMTALDKILNFKR